VFPGPGDQKDLGRYLALGQVGMEMAAPIALGWLADSYLGCGPWGVVAGAALGFVGGLAHLIKLTSPPRRPNSTQGDGAGGSTGREGAP